jgi:arabinose-5-phosphate isomerase
MAKAIEILARTKGAIITTGVGKSGHIARKVSSSMASIGIASVFVHPTDALHGDLGIIQARDALLAFSHSGESTELEAISKHANWLDIPVVAVTSGAESTLARSAAAIVVYPRLTEAWGAAPTTSTTQQLVIGDLLTVAVANSRGISIEDFARNHPGGAIGRGQQ